MPAVRMFSQLSAPRQVLVRICQSVNYGQILGLEIRAGEPVFSPSPAVLVELKLDANEEARPEAGLEEFELCEEVCRLFARLDGLKDGKIERIEVRAGIPRRVVLESRLTEVLP